MKAKDKKVIRTRKWIVEFIEYEDGSAVMNRHNDGFKTFELLGLIEEIRDDVIQRMRGNIKPHQVNRTSIKNK